MPDQQIRHIYWALGANAIAGVIDHVRTILVELVAEMRAGTADAPSAAAADRAVNVAVYGGKPNVNIASAQRAESARITSMHPWIKARGTLGGPRPVRRSSGFATIAGVIIALAQWQGWLL